MLSNKQKMDLLMESLEAIESDSESLNEGEYQMKNVEVRFNDKYSDDPHIALAIEKFKDALRDLEMVGSHLKNPRPGPDYKPGDAEDKSEFVLKKFKRYGIDIERLYSILAKIENGAFNYPPEKSNVGPFDA